MLIKIAALGALGYAGYRYFAGRQGSRRLASTGPAAGPAPQSASPRIALAGGPLSAAAQVQHSPDAPTEGERPQL